MLSSSLTRRKLCRIRSTLKSSQAEIDQARAKARLTEEDDLTEAAARAARRQQDKPYTSISLSKVSIDRCEMAYGTGQSEGYPALTATRQ